MTVSGGKGVPVGGRADGVLYFGSYSDSCMAGLDEETGTRTGRMPRVANVNSGGSQKR